MFRPTRVFVVAERSAPQLSILEGLPGEIELLIGNDLNTVAGREAEIEGMLAWDGVVGGAAGIVPQCLRKLPKLRWIHTRWAGMDSFLFPELVESSIVVTNARGVFADSLAEFVIGGTLYFAKNVPRLRRNQLGRRWEQFDCSMVSGTTMGIFGYGAIGKATAQRAKALGMRVFAIRRSPVKAAEDPFIDEVLPPEKLLEICPRLDFLVVTAPLTLATRHVIGRDVFAALPNRAVVMNVGRGPVIDEAALISALRDGSIRGAALDVFETEPLPEASPLYEMENVLLSPHCADNTATWLDDTMRCFRENLLRFAQGEALANVVDKRAGY